MKEGLPYWPGCTTNAGWMLAYRESVKRYFGSREAAPSGYCDQCHVEVYERRCPHCGKTKRESR